MIEGLAYRAILIFLHTCRLPIDIDTDTAQTSRVPDLGQSIVNQWK